MSRLPVVVALIAVLSSPVLAREKKNPPPSPTPAPAAAGAADPEASHDQAAEELLRVLHLDATMAQTLDLMLKAQIEANHELEKFQDIMHDFLVKYISFDALKPDLIKMYADALTEKELREITAFYQTETGRKCTELIPSLMQKGAALGVEKVQQHADELKAAIEARLKELQEAPPAAPPPAAPPR